MNLTDSMVFFGFLLTAYIAIQEYKQLIKCCLLITEFVEKSEIKIKQIHSFLKIFAFLMFIEKIRGQSLP